MDIERLTKTQTILLTLLISFVTSIATGIATVSLMEEAPTDVTRVISRIIEKPIETVIPGETQVVTRERTVVVSESESIAKAVDAIAPSVVRIYQVSRRGEQQTFLGFGLVVSADGVIAADRRIVTPRQEYVARLDSGTELAIEPLDSGSGEGFFRLVPVAGGALPALVPAAFEAFTALRLGQTVVALGGDSSTRISPGSISELLPAAAGEDAASRIRTTVDASGLSLGSPLITLDGRVIGMPEEAGSQVFLSLREAAE